MISTKTLKYVRQTINHTYVGLQILPLIGDFAGHATNVTKSLYNESVITEDERDLLFQAIYQVERNESESALKSIINTFKLYAGWGG